MQHLKLKPISYVATLADNGRPWQHWYTRAYDEIDAVCDLEQWESVRFTSILAILSPRVSVRRNVRASLIYHGQDEALLTNTLPNVKQSLQTYLETGIVGGLKVPYFRRALLGDCDSITLDSWMAYALQDVDTPHIKHFKRKASLHDSLALVRNVADRLGVSPRDCQAMIWCGMFLESGQLPMFYPIMQEYDNWVEHHRRFPLSGKIADNGNTDLEYDLEKTLVEVADFESDPF